VVSVSHGCGASLNCGDADWILGAGFGGLELATLLSEEFGDDADVVLIDKSDGFIFGFSKLDLMFGRATADHVVHRYAGMDLPGVRFVRSVVRSLDPAARQVLTDGEVLEADILVVALGADLDPSATPGLAEGGHEFYTVAGAVALRGVLERFAGGRVVVGVTSTPFKCPPAPSETALLMHDFLEARGLGGVSQVSLVMPLGVPIPPAPRASQLILAAFAERGIGWHPGQLVRALDPDRKVALLSGGAEMPYDLFLGVPVHRAPAVVAESGLTVDGWIPVDPWTLQTRYRVCTPSGTSLAWEHPRPASSPRDRPPLLQHRSAPRNGARPRQLPTTAAASATWKSGTTWSPRSMSPSSVARAPSGILKDPPVT